jgi:hypothetical protein
MQMLGNQLTSVDLQCLNELCAFEPTFRRAPPRNLSAPLYYKNFGAPLKNQTLSQLIRLRPGSIRRSNRVMFDLSIGELLGVSCKFVSLMNRQ